MTKLKTQIIYFLRVSQRWWMTTTNWRPSIINFKTEIVEWDHNHDLLNIQIEPFYFSTKKGLFGFVDGKLIRIFNKVCYGIITIPDSDKLLCTGTYNNGFSNVCDFIFKVDIRDGNYKYFSKPLRHHVHQIGIFQNYIIATETYHNSLVKIDMNGNIIERWYPAGKAKNQKKNINYKHFNSVFEYDDKLFLFAHNKSFSVENNEMWSSKKSEIFVLNRKGQVLDIIPVDAVNGHNIYVKDNAFMYCDSANDNALKINGNIIFKYENHYLRGLAINNNHIIVGASKIGDNKVREQSDGYINVLDKKYNLILTVKIPKVGQIYDIRFKNNDLAQNQLKLDYFKKK